jgi:transcriptional regulator with XRE-family HTH domain
MPRRVRSREDEATFAGMGMTIVRLRHERGMDQADLAGRIEEKATTLAQIENGEVNADWAILRRIAQALGVPLDSLMELAEEAAPGEGGDEWRGWTREVEQVGRGSRPSGRRCR